MAAGAAQLSAYTLGGRGTVAVARYKVLKSVAHNIAHSFTSTLNWGENDYVMGNLLRRARETGCDTLTIDLLGGEAEPKSLAVPVIRRAARHYADRFRALIAAQGSDLSLVTAALLTVRYDLSVARPSPYGGELESPYSCTAEVTDDRGKLWRAVLSGTWAPEPLRKVRRRWWHFWRPAA